MESLRLLIDVCLTYTHFIFNDWGIAIVLLSVGVRLLLFPAQTYNFIQQRRLRKIQPEIDRVTAEHKDDPMRSFRAIQQIKKRGGVSATAMVVISLLQLPIFLSMYRVISHIPGLAHSPFLWIASLGSPDALYILPLLVALTSYLQMRGSFAASQSSTRHSGAVLKIMPVVSFIFMASLPSALALYYATSGTLQWCGDLALRRFIV